MANQQLSDYVKQQQKQGKAKDEISSELLEAGWQKADIDKALGISGPPAPPKPPSPPPSFTPTNHKNLDPKAVWLFFFKFVFTFLFIALWLGLSFAAALADTLPGALTVGIVVLLGAVVFAFVWAKLTYYFYRFELTEEGFRKELGVIFKKYVTIPYDRIQNVDIYRGIMDRILGLSDLNIQTAGTSGVRGAEGRLPGLSHKDAEQLRNELIHRARQTRNQGL
jgi:uncharacterized membrane protein YdbT with pleckstrin-like domain